MTRENQRIDFEDKLYLAKINNVVDTARRDVMDRTTFVNLTFNGSSFLTSFINDLRKKSTARQGWEALVSIRTKNGKTIQILDHFNSIKENKMKDEKVNQTSEEYNLSNNIYITVWRSLSSAPKREMKVYREEIGCEGTTLLWYLFKYYHSTAEHTFHTTFAMMKNLPTTIKHQCKGNIEKFATYVIIIFITPCQKRWH